MDEICCFMFNSSLSLEKMSYLHKGENNQSDEMGDKGEQQLTMTQHCTVLNIQRHLEAPLGAFAR